MIPQPSYAQAGSVYYICLLRDDLLLHQGTINTSCLYLNFCGAKLAFLKSDYPLLTINIVTIVMLCSFL